MQTITINQIRQNPELLFADYGKEPVLLKNENSQTYLLMPFSNDKRMDISLLFTILNPPNNAELNNSPTSFEEFDKKWSGFLKDVELPDNWREEYINEKMEKHR